MEPKQNFAAVGLFVLLTAGGIVLSLLWLSGYLDNRDTACFAMRFDGSVAGLSQGSAITYRGVNVGRVDTIRINPNNDAQILVRALLDGKAPVKADTIAQLKPQGITGASYIELAPGVNVPPMGAVNGCRVIATLPSNIDKIVNTLPEILDRALEVADRLNTVLSHQNTENLSGTLENLSALSAQLNAQSKVVGPDIAQATAQLRETLEHVNALAGSLQQNSDGNLQALQDAVRQTSQAMQQIRDLAQDLRRNPSRVLVSPKVKEERVP